jgi:hypothetical protein
METMIALILAAGIGFVIGLEWGISIGVNRYTKAVKFIEKKWAKQWRG